MKRLLWLAFLPFAASAESVLHIGNGADPESLDPHRAQTVPAMNIARDVFEGLTRIDPAGRPAPAAAESWDVSEDGLAWTFDLRPGLKWSNGDALVAAHFVAGLQRAVAPETASAYSAALAVIEHGADILEGRRAPAELGVEVVDADRLRIRLVRPTPYLPALLALPMASPMHPGGPATTPKAWIGNGAYVVEEWQLQAHVRLRRNPLYWDDANTGIDVVYYHPTEDRDAELKRYRAGELDITYSVPQARAGWIRRQLGDELRVATYLGTYYLGFNCTAPPFAGQDGLRRALSLAIDREVIADKVLRGLGRPAGGWVPPGVAGHASLPPDGTPRAERWEQAGRLYAAAGYSKERPLHVVLRYSTSPDNRRLATVVAAMWKQALGVRTSLVNEENRVLLNRLRNRSDLQAFLWSWIGDYNDASTFLDVLRPGSPVNYTGWEDGEYGVLLDAAARSVDDRADLLRRAEQRLLDQQPLAPLYFYVSRHLVKPRVRGWTDHLLDYHYSRDLRLAGP